MNTETITEIIITQNSPECWYANVELFLMQNKFLKVYSNIDKYYYIISEGEYLGKYILKNHATIIKTISSLTGKENLIK